MSLVVEEWVSDREACAHQEAPLGGWGGWFNWEEKGQRWGDYTAVWADESQPYLEP